MYPLMRLMMLPFNPHMAPVKEPVVAASPVPIFVCQITSSSLHFFHEMPDDPVQGPYMDEEGLRII